MGRSRRMKPRLCTPVPIFEVLACGAFLYVVKTHMAPRRWQRTHDEFSSRRMRVFLLLCGAGRLLLYVQSQSPRRGGGEACNGEQARTRILPPKSECKYVNPPPNQCPLLQCVRKTGCTSSPSSASSRLLQRKEGDGGRGTGKHSSSPVFRLEKTTDRQHPMPLF